MVPVTRAAQEPRWDPCGKDRLEQCRLLRDRVRTPLTPVSCLRPETGSGYRVCPFPDVTVVRDPAAIAGSVSSHAAVVASLSIGDFRGSKAVLETVLRAVRVHRRTWI